MYSATERSLVTRVAFFAATETPFLRRTTTACSKSPLASVRACLQSIIGAPVFSRSSFTCAAEMFAIVVLIPITSLRLHNKPAPWTSARVTKRLDSAELETTQRRASRPPPHHLERLDVR